MTPNSTPQAIMTVSPDPSGPSNNAPPTPAPTETAASIAENDPDAHLVDTTDESWGMLLAPTYASPSNSDCQSSSRYSTSTPSTALVSGVLFKRGDSHSPASNCRLQSLSVSLHWDIRIRPSGAVDEGPAKQAEATLREVLRMYRNLGLLTKVRRLDSVGQSFADQGKCFNLMPVHVAGAVKAADALDGFLA